MQISGLKKARRKKKDLAIVHIGVGSNLGKPEDNIEKAIEMIRKEKVLQDIQTSSFYLTEPVGPKEQPDFLNLVIKGKTEFTPLKLLNSLLKIEDESGRKKKERWGPREVDLDILFYDDAVINRNNLVIPHPEIPNRRFVLVPLVEISPSLMHPVLKKSVKQLLDETEDQSKVELHGGIHGSK